MGTAGAGDQTRVCSKCGAELPLDCAHFYVRTKAPLTFRKDCKHCIRERGLKYRADNHAKILASKKIYRDANRNMLRKKASQYNSLGDVRERSKEYKKDYYKTEGHRRNHLESNKKYRQRPDIRCKIKQQASDRYYLDVDKSRIKAREYKRTEGAKAKARARYKMTRTVNKKLRSAISSSVTKGLRRGNCSKQNNSCWQYLGYSPAELRAYLESLFEPWMNWSNYGTYRADNWDDNNMSTWTWNIDHIKRHREFDYKSMEDLKFKECWKLSNLRPLSAKANNMRK